MLSASFLTSSFTAFSVFTLPTWNPSFSSSCPTFSLPTDLIFSSELTPWMTSANWVKVKVELLSFWGGELLGSSLLHVGVSLAGGGVFTVSMCEMEWTFWLGDSKDLTVLGCVLSLDLCSIPTSKLSFCGLFCELFTSAICWKTLPSFCLCMTLFSSKPMVTACPVLCVLSSQL